MGRLPSPCLEVNGARSDGMRIGIDFHTAEREGTGNCSYIRNLVESLLVLDRENDYVLYVTHREHPYLRRFEGRPRVRIQPLGTGHALGRWLTLGRRARRDGVDILHVQYVAPLFFGGRLIVSVHDLAYKDLPELFPARLRFYLRTLVPLSLRGASCVLTLSEFSRSSLAARYPSYAGKIRVIPLAASPGLRGGADRVLSPAVRRKLGIRGKFILYVGRLDARKNLSVLLQAFSSLKRTRRIPHQLVVVGRMDFWPPALQREWDRNEFKADIVRTGLVAEGNLAALYSSADVFVFPSLYEGFGLPVLEAMACGCPVVCSNTSSLPEVVGQAALLVSAGASDPLAEGILRIISDRRLRTGLKKKGLERARRFSWMKTAKETLAVYRQAGAAFN